MACQTGKWRYGLLPLAALWIGANWIETGRIERDLANKARLALDRVAGGAGNPKISGRDLTLEGVIADPAVRAAALASVGAVAGVRKITDAAPASAPTASAGATAATGAAGLASGAASNPPSTAAAAPQSPPVAALAGVGKVADAAPVSAPTTSVNSTLAPGASGPVASGAAPTPPSAPAAAPRSPPVAAPGPDSGEQRANVDVLPAQPPQSSPAGDRPAPATPSATETPASAPYVLRAEKSQGAAPNPPSTPAAAPRSPPVAAPGLDSGAQRANVDVLPARPQSSPAGDRPAPATPSATETPAAVAPYVLHAEKLQGKLTLTGFYPDADSHAALLAAAAKNFPGLEVIDTMQPGAGAPKAFGEAAVSGLEKLAQLREGALDLSDRSARLIGEAADDGLADEIRAGLIGSLPSGFAVDTLLTSPARELPALEPNAAGAPVAAAPPDPKPTAQPAAPMEAAACQAQMAALVKDRPIQFASGSAQILPESVSTLRALAEAASKCPQGNFEIAGHTDDVGRVSRNEDLSRRRAESVLVYLVASGVEPQRLSAAGYGEHRPLVPNDNDENRAKNRRIEFNVK